MKKSLFILFFLFIAYNSFAQCYTTVVTYDRNILARRADGTLWCMGGNFYGGLGNGTNTPIITMTQIGTDTNWTNNISIDGAGSFAIKTNGTLWAWGSKTGIDFGFGNTNSYQNLTPTQVGTDTNWATIADSATPLAIKTDGTLWAWGGNYDGKLGNGNIDDNFTVNVPTQVGTASNWQKVYSNKSIRIAIKTDGTLWSWGSHYNDLGYPNSNLNNTYRTPHQIGTDTDWVTATVNGSLGQFSAAIKTNGTLWGWGITYTFFGAYFFGNGISDYNSVTPIQIGTDTNWKTVTASPKTISALKTNGTRWGWGENQYYQLGMGTGFNSNVTIPTQSDTAVDWKYISIDIADGYGVGIKENNSLYRWGYIGFNSPFLLSPETCVLANSDFESDKTIVIFPNPVTNSLTIHCNENDNLPTTVTITNMLGQKVFIAKKELFNNNNEILVDVSTFQSGIYLVTVKNNNKIVQTKIMKN